MARNSGSVAYVAHNTTIPFSRVGWASVSGDPETGYLYAQNGDGQLIAFDRAGKTVWETRLGEEMGRSSGYGGRTHSPLIDGDSLLVSIVGVSWGEHAPLRQRYASLDKRTGKVQWFVSPSTANVEDFNNQANAIVANIGGERLMIGGGADGWIYALRARTGELVWNFKFSPRSLNAPVTVRDGIVYANQSDEPLEGGFMGQVIAIDGTLKGDITATGRKWNANAHHRRFRSAPCGWESRVRRRQLREPACARRHHRRASVRNQARHHRPRLGDAGRREDLHHRGERQRPHHQAPSRTSSRR